MITKQELTDSHEGKNSIFAYLAHDLKTPILAQSKILDLILENRFGAITSPQREVIAELRNSCEYMKHLVQDIISLYKFENHQMILRNEVFCVREVINEVIQELSVLSSAKHLLLTFITETNPSYLTGDRIQIKRCIINLMSNAITYSTENSEIIIKSDKTQNELIFSVMNKSSFLLPEVMESFFDKFKSNHFQGNSGLGLYIVKQIISAHRGSVFVNKIKNNACVFGFKIPVD